MHCFSILSNHSNYVAHQKTCKKNKNKIIDKPIIKTIIPPIFYYLHPKNEFIPIDGVDINIFNIYSLFKISIDNPIENYNQYIIDICNIIKDTYHTDINIYDRIIWSYKNMDSICEIHYYSNNKWINDINCANMIDKIINILLNKIKIVCNNIINILNAIISYDINYLKEYEVKYNILTILQLKYNCFNINSDIKHIIDIYDKYKYNNPNTNIITFLKKYNPMTNTKKDSYNNIIKKYSKLINFIDDKKSINLIMMNIKNVLLYNTVNNDDLIKMYISA